MLTQFLKKSWTRLFELYSYADITFKHFFKVKKEKSKCDVLSIKEK